MAYIFSITILIISMLLNEAHANQPSTIGYQSGNSDQIFQTPQAVCDFDYQLFLNNPYNSKTPFTASGGNCYSDNQYRSHINQISSCPTGQTLIDANTCTGSPPIVCNTDSVGTVEFPTAYPNSNDFPAGLKAEIVAGGCYNGCQVRIDGNSSQSMMYRKVGTNNFIVSEAVRTGSTCTTSTPAVGGNSLTVTQKDCLAQGKTFGQVNGVDVCLKTGTKGSAPVLAIADKTQTGTGKNPTATTSFSTVNNDNSVTTSTVTTITNPDGTKSTSETANKQDKPSFCEENPNSKICQDDKKSTFTGSCPQSTCDGDAIQCAIARRQQQDACDAQASKEALISKPSYTTGQKLVNGQYDDDVQSFMNGTGDSKRTVNISSSLSEDGQANYASNGFADVTVSALGRNITLPISKVNEYFGYFGFVLLALSYLAGYKIISGSI